jgi:hypothetical protein
MWLTQPDVMCMIFECLHPFDLLACERVCLLWSSILNSNVVWQNVYASVYYSSNNNSTSSINNNNNNSNNNNNNNSNNNIDFSVINNNSSAKVSTLKLVFFLQNRQKVIDLFDVTPPPLSSYFHKEGTTVTAQGLKNLWTSEVVYDFTVDNNVLHVEYDTMMEYRAESMIGFSWNRQSWNSFLSPCDSLSIRLVSTRQA